MSDTRIFLSINLAIIAILVLVTIFAPQLAPHSPYEQVLLERFQAISKQHLLGTDNLGRDIFSRLLYGGRFSLLLSAVATLISAAIGLLIALLALSFGKWLDSLLMRVLDFFIAFPTFILSLIVAALLEASFWSIVFALCLTGWTPYARLARAAGLETRSKVFVEAARALGASRWRLLRCHILPNMLTPIYATLFLRYGHTFLLVAALSFLGLGPQPPSADWGLMLLEARPYMQRVPLMMLAPGTIIFVTAWSVSMVGQVLQSARVKR